MTYETKADCKLHLNFEHPKLDDGQMRDVLRTAGQQAELPRQCFDCLEEFVEKTDIMVLQRHMASHLQAIFVLALPWREDVPETAMSSNDANSASSKNVDNDNEVTDMFRTKEDPRWDQPASESREPVSHGPY